MKSSKNKVWGLSSCFGPAMLTRVWASVGQRFCNTENANQMLLCKAENQKTGPPVMLRTSIRQALTLVFLWPETDTFLNCCDRILFPVARWNPNGYNKETGKQTVLKECNLSNLPTSRGSRAIRDKSFLILIQIYFTYMYLF